MQLPVLSDGKVWKVKVNTNCEYVDGRDYTEYTEFLGVNTIRVPARTTIILSAEPFMEISATEIEDDIDIQNTELAQNEELAQSTEDKQNIDGMKGNEAEKGLIESALERQLENILKEMPDRNPHS